MPGEFSPCTLALTDRSAGLHHGTPRDADPGLPVPGQERRRPRLSQAFDRGERPLAVGRLSPRDNAGSPKIGVGIVGDQRIAREEDAAFGQVERAVAQRVSRRKQNTGEPGTSRIPSSLKRRTWLMGFIRRAPALSQEAMIGNLAGLR